MDVIGTNYHWKEMGNRMHHLNSVPESENGAKYLPEAKGEHAAHM